jgi:hypothetical protein
MADTSNASSTKNKSCVNNNVYIQDTPELYHSDMLAATVEIRRR